MSTLARQNMRKVQKVQKQWYDRRTCEHEFSVGENMLALLLTLTHKLLAKWMGPSQCCTRLLLIANFYLMNIHNC